MTTGAPERMWVARPDYWSDMPWEGWSAPQIDHECVEYVRADVATDLARDHDRVVTERDDAKFVLEETQKCAEALQTERDAARAEVERLRGPALQADMEHVLRLVAERDAAREAHDAAQTELERLRDRITRADEARYVLAHEVSAAKARLRELEPDLGKTSWVARCDYDRVVSERDAARAVVDAARDAWSNCDPTSKAFQILDQAIRKHDGTESHSIDRFLAAAKGGDR